MFGDVCRLCTKSHTIASNLRVALSANYEEGHTDRFRASLWQCRWWFAIAISLRLCTPRRPHGSMSVWLTFISSTFHWLIVGRFKDFFKCCAKKTFVPGFAKLLRCVQLVGDKPTTPRVIWLLLARKGTVMSVMSRSRPQIPASRPHGLTSFCWLWWCCGPGSSLPSARVVQPVRAAPAPEEDAWRLYLEGLCRA